MRNLLSYVEMLSKMVAKALCYIQASFLARVLKAVIPLLRYILLSFVTLQISLKFDRATCITCAIFSFISITGSNQARILPEHLLMKTYDYYGFYFNEKVHSIIE